jgi:hypothetical protein
VILAVAIMSPVLATYAYKLQQKNYSLEQQAALRTNQDHSHMLLAVRDIPAVNVLAGERCIFSEVDCERQPHRIEAICKRQGVVVIAQPDWSGFVRLPREDFPVPVLESLSGILCTRHSMTRRSMYATQDQDRCGGTSSGDAADSG